MIVPDQDRTTFNVALDDVTVARLMEMADACHVHPCALIAALVHDILEDDARHHGSAAEETLSLH